MAARDSNVTIGIGVTYPRHDLIQARLLRYGSDDVDFIRFGPNDILFSSREVSGYKAKIDRVRGKVSWIWGMYPVPDVIYLDGRVEQEMVQRMVQLIGKNVFNSFTFDKLEGHELLRQDPLLSRHLPDACSVYAGEGLNPDVDHFLRRHREVYVKPADGASGKGVFVVRLGEDGQVHVSSFEQGEKAYPNLWEWLPKLKPGWPYIMQQSITTVRWYGLPTDIRLNMCKNGEGKWEEAFLMSRAALSGDYIRLNHYRMLLRRDFPDLFMRIKKSSEEIEAEILKVGHRICGFFDESGHHMADLGIDLGIDGSGKVWIFEVNPLPYPYTMAFGDMSLIRPLEYARFLARRSLPQH
ncbi:hypothetical protein D3P08_21500 [Paenibacillus nanensis]|uniref:YheC/YheD family protein n=1 Tax=Paenibacillus nanensis TaxID=393251 RepID=A0A3A1UQQ0_9BACL|nr:YheC/YheD family protein [Paenibacillus nanensis]RIX50126.1 hypothetical protein D3P08_21500 [Paenibacillus nanensis]